MEVCRRRGVPQSVATSLKRVGAWARGSAGSRSVPVLAASGCHHSVTAAGAGSTAHRPSHGMTSILASHVARAWPAGTSALGRGNQAAHPNRDTGLIWPIGHPAGRPDARGPFRVGLPGLAAARSTHPPGVWTHRWRPPPWPGSASPVHRRPASRTRPCFRAAAPPDARGPHPRSRRHPGCGSGAGLRRRAERSRRRPPGLDSGASSLGTVRSRRCPHGAASRDYHTACFRQRNLPVTEFGRRPRRLPDRTDLVRRRGAAAVSAPTLAGFPHAFGRPRYSGRGLRQRHRAPAPRTPPHHECR